MNNNFGLCSFILLYDIHTHIKFHYITSFIYSLSLCVFISIPFDIYKGLHFSKWLQYLLYFYCYAVLKTKQNKRHPELNV